MPIKTINILSKLILQLKINLLYL